MLLEKTAAGQTLIARQKNSVQNDISDKIGVLRFH
jgi:hypothetical protein